MLGQLSLEQFLDRGVSRRSKPLWPARWLAFLFLLSLTGCGSSGGVATQTVPVKGRILLANGDPLTSGRVAFVPTDDLNRPASGLIGSDGRFILTTKEDGDGAAPGEYRVRIEPADGQNDRRKSRKPRFPLKYVDEDSSGLLVTVKVGDNELEPLRLK